MYSLLMMAALSGGASESPAFGGRLLSFGGCGGCGGFTYAPSYYGACHGSACYGGSYYSACTGCYGSSCLGCCGGYVASCTGCCGGFLGLAGHFHHGCCGGYTSSYYYGSCVGSSCCGGCYGLPYYSAYGGCYGSCLGAVPAVPVYPVYGPLIHTAPVVGVIASATPDAAVVTASRDEPGTNGYSAAAPRTDGAPARLTVELPADAKLYVDGSLVPGEGTTRQFHTPELARGKEFYYELKAIVTVEGKPETEEKKVVVRAGDSAIEAFPKLLALAKPAAGPTTVATK